ncbi:TVP38/TMEM64 family protein [Alkalicoccobacillus murimartini]|uniref:TVP38/TMEM64 family membrane protein n=1 Tax=Alkalicoccobacillus murimartini TaxID=171685 RepID=A0ABT9YGN3_9BACI|nr:TVP38/TMEM64 family protein [Alkalicoccobacillus murimartini]MDQ0206846.1 putative membrane protein YdjX (TVP38/TMEM64 family) [Alkalicoccobacillus murimartini]
MKRKLGVLIFFLAIGILVYINRLDLMTWIQNYGQQSIVLTTIAATLFALFPVIPFPVIGAILGVMYGPALGSLVTWIGSSVASIIMFIAIRFGFQDWGRRVITRYKSLDKITTLFERNAFMTIFISRMVPVIPSIVANSYFALSRVSLGVYSLASTIGKIPSMILFATVGSTLMSNPGDLLFVGLYYIGFLMVVYSCYRVWARRPGK